MHRHNHRKLVFLSGLSLAVLLLAGLLLGGARADPQDQPGPLYLPLLTHTGPQQNIVIQPEWLNYLNTRRAIGNLPATQENSAFSDGCVLHSRYMVKNNVLIHDEDIRNTWYTPAGKDAAGNSNLMASSLVSASDEHAIDMWLTGPFHGLGLLDPRLLSTGFGTYREADGGFAMGGCLDVYRGFGSLPATVNFPIYWPGPEQVMPYFAYYGGESPDPLASCPGYKTPSGPPIYLMLGLGTHDVQVNAHSFSSNGQELESCLFDKHTYNNPNSGQQDLGRWALGFRDAVVVMPRDPLAPGTRYTVSVTAGVQNYHWSFTTSSAGLLAPISEEPLQAETGLLLNH
jgi:hypothetical protein